MQRIFSLLEKTAKTNITVAITGQTGTGKELVAKAIHFNSERMKRPFIAINVAAIPKELIESELFGYEKGAFTGADQSRAGKFEEANKGTLFLDEIGEMDLNMQSKLLRALQEREVTRLGSNKLIPLDVRIIVATHRDLQKEVKAGNFREDLYYRLLGISIDLPPLSDRGNDIILLARTFTTDFCVENKLQKKDFTQEAIDKLLKYGYPGNVRELKAVVEIASVMSDGNLIKDTDIQFNERTDVEDLLQENLTLEEFNAKIIRWNLKKFNNNFTHLTEKWDSKNSLKSSEVNEIYSETKIIPAPMGNINVDSFRICEILESGSIPIIKLYNGNDYFINIFGNHPIPVVSDWDELFLVFNQLRDNEEKLKEINEWYYNFKENLRIKVKNLLN